MGFPRVLLVDNYDSFTFNVVQALGALGAEVVVRRHDALELAWVSALAPTHLVVSPGPGRPEAAGITVPLLRALAPRLPVLGICLGHQALAVAFGGRIGYARRIMHGKTSEVRHAGTGLFAGLPSPFPAGRYHSLAVDRLPPGFVATAWAEDGELMAMAHERWPVHGVQFHPESVLTPDGPALLSRFLALEARG